MRPPLWSKVLGIILGITLSAGAAYAAVHYIYEKEIPSSVTVRQPTFTSESPGLDVTPTSLDFGTIEPNYGAGSKHISDKAALAVKNIGHTPVSLVLIADNLPQGLGFQEDSANTVNQEPGTQPNTGKVTLSGRNWSVAPGSTYTLYPYVIASENITAGVYSFRCIVKGG